MKPRPDIAGPVRTCVGCGVRDAQASLVRLTRDGAGALVVAATPRIGRGAWIHANGACAAGLERSKGLGKSLRATVTKEARLAARRLLEAQFGCASHGAGPGAGGIGEASARR